MSRPCTWIEPSQWPDGSTALCARTGAASNRQAANGISGREMRLRMTHKTTVNRNEFHGRVCSLVQGLSLLTNGKSSRHDLVVKDSFYTFVIAALAVWRVTHLVSEEEGPWHVFARLRRGLDGLFRTTAASCFYCASVWIAIPPALWMATGSRGTAASLAGAVRRRDRPGTRDQDACASRAVFRTPRAHSRR